MAQIGFWSRARAGCGGGLGRGSGNYNGNECESGMRQRPGCWEGFIKYGTAVIWSGPRGYWPPREEITVKRAGETTSWWMYYLCKGLIDEAGDSFTEEASARSNLIKPPLRHHPTRHKTFPWHPPLYPRLWLAALKRRPQVIIKSQTACITFMNRIWMCSGFAKQTLLLFLQGWRCATRVGGVILTGRTLIWLNFLWILALYNQNTALKVIYW